MAEQGLRVAVIWRQLVDHGRLRASLQSATRTPLSGRLLDRLAVWAYLQGIGLHREELRDPAWAGLLELMSPWVTGGIDHLRALLGTLLPGKAGAGVSPCGATEAAAGPSRPAASAPPPRHATAEALRATFPSAFGTGGGALMVPPALQQRLAGGFMLARAVAGSPLWPSPQPGMPAATREAILERSRLALQALGLSLPPRGQRQAFVTTFGRAPGPLQDTLAHQLVPSDDTRIIVAECEARACKEEAALAWFFRLYERRLVDGLYLAASTEAAARDLQPWVQQGIDKAFADPATRPRPVQVATDGPGMACMAEGCLHAAPAPALAQPAADTRAHAACGDLHRLQVLAAPVVLGTRAQVLLATSSAADAPMRSVCLDRQLLIVDDLHASDPCLQAGLPALLAGHVSRGGWALVLSGTLGECATAALLGRPLQPLGLAPTRLYPVVSTRHREIAIAPDGHHLALQVEHLVAPGFAALLPRLAHSLAAGARVLVVCNTPSRAQALMMAVMADAGCAPFAQRLWPTATATASATATDKAAATTHTASIALEPARPPVPDHLQAPARPHPHRQPPDPCALTSAAPGHGPATGALPPSPALVICTPGQEPGPAFDPDWLVTDLCPMDVLLQRVGTLHRQPRGPRPPGFETARVLVCTPAADLSAFLEPAGPLRLPAGWGTAQADGRILQRTLDLLISRPQFDLPTHARWLVEQATHPQALAELASAPWAAHAAWLRSAGAAARAPVPPGQRL